MGRIQRQSLIIGSHNTPSNKAQQNWAHIMQSKRSAWGVIFLVTLFILQGTSQLAFHNEPIQTEITENDGIEWVSFELKDGVYLSLIHI